MKHPEDNTSDAISDEDYLRAMEGYERDFKELESRVELAGPVFESMLQSNCSF